MLFRSIRDDFLRILPTSLERVNIQDVYPTLETQAAYASSYVVDCFPLHLYGTLDVARLERACQALVERYAALRTIFHHFRQQKLLQVVLWKLQISLTVHQCTSSTDTIDRVESLGQGEITKHHDIKQPITGFFLVQALHDQHHILLMRLSHGQYDGLCVRPLIQGIWQAYRSEAFPLQNEFKTHVQRCFERRTSQAYIIWREILEAAPLPTLPLTPPMHDGKAKVGVFRRPLPGVNPLPGTTRASMIKAAWMETLWQETGREDVVFGQFVNAWTGTEGMIGPCMNVIPVRKIGRAHV